MRSILTRLTGAFLLALCVAAPAAMAQRVVPNIGPVVGTAPPPPPSAAPLPGLPGAKSGPVAPPTVPLAQMSPTVELFDAIDRGDIAAARDAIGRGADLNGHNVLGQTPIDLSVDLGRNNITFLLLSLRRADAGGGKATPAAAVASKAPPLSAQVRPMAPAARPIVPPAPAPMPQLFANDGGTPKPSVGFLGFGGGTPQAQ